MTCGASTPPNYPTLTELRRACIDIDDLERAIGTYRDLVAVNSCRYQYWIDLVNLYDEIGDYKAAKWAVHQGAN